MRTICHLLIFIISGFFIVNVSDTKSPNLYFTADNTFFNTSLSLLKIQTSKIIHYFKWYFIMNNILKQIKL